MDTAKKKALAVSFNAVLFASCPTFAAELTLTPQVFFTSTYSDNVELAAKENEEDAFVGTIGAGLTSQAEFAGGSMALAYTARQTTYSHDSDRNEFYNELYFDAEKQLKNGLYVDSSASITPVSRGADVNTLTDYISGDSVERQSYTVGLGYRTNPHSRIDFDLHLAASMVRYEDEIADNDSQQITMAFRNGRAEKRAFWLYELSYRSIDSDTTSNSNTDQQHRIELGLQAIYGWSPFIHFYSERYEQDLSASLTRENMRVGPGVRYYWRQGSYIEVNYNFDLDDEPDDVDYLGAALRVQPSRRTLLTADYSKRYFGDAFSFSLSHRTKRLTNSITYREEPTSYNRDFFQSEDLLQTYRLEKRLQWDTDFVLRRTSYRFSMSRIESSGFSDLSDEREDIRHQASLTASRQIKRTLAASLQLTYEDNQLERQQSQQRNDEYWWAEATLRYQFVAGLSLQGGVRIAQRNTDEVVNEFNENRIYLNLYKTF